MDSNSIAKDLTISTILKNWYKANKRDLPWRNTTDPYQIWLSEIILQQTRVNQGYDYFVKFIKNYPTIKTLATANEDDVLKLWQGLGYYSRARNLHTTAKIIVEKYNGIFPITYKEVISLKGIGEYTAAAIVSFAYNMPYAVVDGNVYRVLSRLFNINTAIDSSAGKKIFSELAKEILDDKNPGLHNQAIMELGALQCTPTSPDCENCPVINMCLAYKNRTVDMLPYKQGKTLVKNRYFNYFDIRFKEHTYINKRVENDIWKNLYEFPLIETDEELTIEKLSTRIDFRELLPKSFQITHVKLDQKHILSHRIIHTNFYQIEVNDDSHLIDKYKKIHLDSFGQYAIPRLIHKYIEDIATP